MKLPRIPRCLLARSGRAAHPRRRAERCGRYNHTAPRCGASPSGHWRLRACSPFSSPDVIAGGEKPTGHRRCRQAVTAAKPGFAEGGPDRRTTARARAIQSATARHSIPSRSLLALTVISTRSSRSAGAPLHDAVTAGTRGLGTGSSLRVSGPDIHP